MNRFYKKLLLEKSYFSCKYCMKPEFLSLLITFACNFQCKSCSIWEKKNIDELSDEKWLELVKKLKYLEKNTFVEINGGEPLIRRNLTIKLIKELKDYFKTVALNTNGLLVDAEIVKELEDAGLDILKLSFYSNRSETHNFLRGTDDAFLNAIKTINTLQLSKIKLEIGVLITSYNINSLIETFEYLKTLKNCKIILQALDEKIESYESKNKITNNITSHLWPEKGDVERFFNYLKEINYANIKNSRENILAIKEYYLCPSAVLKYRCFAGQRNLVVYPSGDVSMCFKGNIIGNLTQNNIKDLLLNKDAKNERLSIKNCQKYCRIIGCNFSRGIKEFLKR
jgi:MoaA/NifB/PqqE/SkfB family radical SAM enzyme